MIPPCVDCETPEAMREYCVNCHKPIPITKETIQELDYVLREMARRNQLTANKSFHGGRL